MCEDVTVVRPVPALAATGSAMVLVTLVLYAELVGSQGSGDLRRAAIVVAILAVLAVLGTVASWSASPLLRSVVFVTVAGALLGFGWLAIFSIGIILIAEGGLFFVAALKALSENGSISARLAAVIGAAQPAPGRQPSSS